MRVTTRPDVVAGPDVKPHVEQLRSTSTLGD